MSEDTKTTKRTKFGRLIRNNIPELFPEEEYRVVEGDTLKAYTRLRIWEVARDLAKAKTNVDALNSCVDILELIATVMVQENFAVRQVQNFAEQKNNEEGTFSAGNIHVSEKVVHTGDDAFTGSLEVE